MTTEDELQIIGEARFYCQCVGTNVEHLLLIELRHDTTCSDLVGVKTRCTWCSRERDLPAGGVS